MKATVTLIAILSVATMAAGCKPAEPTTSEQLEKARVETKAAAQDMKDYTFAQKSQFVDTMQTQLDAINRDLAQVSAKIEASSAAAKAEAKPKLEALRLQADKLNKQLDEVKNATESTWDGVKAGFKSGYQEMKDGVLQARQWVSDKIAP